MSFLFLEKDGVSPPVTLIYKSNHKNQKQVAKKSELVVRGRSGLNIKCKKEKGNILHVKETKG